VALIDVVLTQCRVLFQYLSVTLVPLPEKVQLVAPQVLSRGILEPPITLPAVILTAALIACGIYLLKKRPLSGFGVLFYVLNLIPEALLVPQYAFFGYRAVLPMAGLCLVLTDCGIAALDAVRGSRMQRRVRLGLLGLTAAVVALMGTVSVERARIWSDEVRFWKEAVNQFPSQSVDFETRVEVQVLANLGRALYLRGDYPQAVYYYQAALRLRPSDALTLASVGAAYAKLGSFQEAENALKRSLEICSDLAFAHEKLGELLIAQNQRDEAQRHFEQAADLSRRNPYQGDRVCPEPARE
jgi:tetratricopeptide (TPR) repeat protein